jgi:hypothetical protein
MAEKAGEAVPRVLILGDSSYNQPSQQMAKFLKGKVEIVFPPIKPGEARNSSTGLVNLDVLMGEGKWDLICFNFGLGDLIHRAPGMKSFRVMSSEAGGVRTTDPKQYAKNLTELIKRLKATGAKLVWASTTPIRKDLNGLFEIGSETKYNAIAAKVMAANRVPVIDMHSKMVTLLEAVKPQRDEPFSFGKAISIHPPLVVAICRKLALPVPPEAAKQPEPRGKRK